LFVIKLEYDNCLKVQIIEGVLGLILIRNLLISAFIKDLVKN